MRWPETSTSFALDPVRQLEASEASREIRRARRSLYQAGRGSVDVVAEYIGDPPAELADVRIHVLLTRVMLGEPEYRNRRLADLNTAAAREVDLNIMDYARTMTVRQRLWLIDQLPELVDGRIAALRLRRANRAI